MKSSPVGFNKAIMSKVSTMVDKSEYKRRQPPPGIKVTSNVFGKTGEYQLQINIE
jgi:NH3-dependent NAD+ synthetase